MRGLVGEGIGERDAVLGRGAERLLERDGLVAEVELEVLAGLAVGHGEERDEMVVHELADASEQTRVSAGDVGLAHGQLGRNLGASTEHAREGEPLLAAEVEVAREGVEARELLAGIARELREVVGRARAVVEERAGLGEAHEGIGADVFERTRRLAIERREVLVERGLRAAGFDEPEVGGHLRVVLCIGPEGLARAGHGVVGEGNLAAGAHGDRVQVADGLAGGGHHATHAVDLVAKELHAHGRRSLRREDVDRVAVDVEGARAIELAGVGVAEAHEQRPDVLERHLVAHRERGARPVA